MRLSSSLPSPPPVGDEHTNMCGDEHPYVGGEHPYGGDEHSPVWDEHRHVCGEEHKADTQT